MCIQGIEIGLGIDGSGVGSGDFLLTGFCSFDDFACLVNLCERDEKGYLNDDYLM